MRHIYKRLFEVVSNIHISDDARKLLVNKRLLPSLKRKEAMLEALYRRVAFYYFVQLLLLKKAGVVLTNFIDARNEVRKFYLGKLQVEFDVTGLLEANDVDKFFLKPELLQVLHEVYASIQKAPSLVELFSFQKYYVAKEASKKLGQIFTSYDRATDIVAKALAFCKRSEKMKIVEPASGLGVFVVALLEKLAMQGVEAEIVCYEIDAFAHLVAKHIITYAVSDFVFGETVKIDFRLESFISKDDEARIYNKQRGIFSTFGEKFDLVITNVPFVRCEVANFRLEVANIFAVKCVDCLSDGGIAALLVPQAVLEAAGYVEARERLLQYNWLRVDVLPHTEFPVATVVLYIAFSKDKRGLTCVYNMSNSRKVMMPQEYFVWDRQFKLGFDYKVRRLVQYIANFPTFEDIARTWWRRKEGNRYVEASLEL